MNHLSHTELLLHAIANFENALFDLTNGLISSKCQNLGNHKWLLSPDYCYILFLLSLFHQIHGGPVVEDILTLPKELQPEEDTDIDRNQETNYVSSL